jgi:hypothetical protein
VSLTKISTDCHFIWRYEVGTDIHLFIEFARGEGDRRARFSLTRGEFLLARDYDLFSAIAHVRGGKPIVPERGFPDDASQEVVWSYYLFVNDTDIHLGLWQDVTRATADEYVARGISSRHIWKDNVVISDPDTHHPSWLDRAEFNAAVDSATGVRERHVELQAVLAALDALPADAQPRVVFWFDN